MVIRIINIFVIFHLILFTIACIPSIKSQYAQAGCVVTVKNETGYDLEPLKYVREIGDAKQVVGQVRLANGRSYTFNLRTGGSYRAYAALQSGGIMNYAKGNLYNISDGTKSELTLKKVVFSEKGSSITFIKKEEFDALK